MEKTALLPLLPLQKGMLFLSQVEKQSNYNAFTRLSLNGDIDPVRLQQALITVLKRPQLGGHFDSELAEEPVFIYHYILLKLGQFSFVQSLPICLSKPFKKHCSNRLISTNLWLNSGNLNSTCSRTVRIIDYGASSVNRWLVNSAVFTRLY